MRRSLLQFVENRIADALGVASQMRIPEPQRLDSARFQKPFPFRVVFPLVGEAMLAAVQFNVQSRLLAKKIQIVAADWMLAAKFVVGETPVTQPAPDKFFRPCFHFAKLAGAFDVCHDGNLRPGDEMKSQFLVRPHPDLLPRGEGTAFAQLIFSPDRPANPVAGFSKRRPIILLLPGEKAGVWP